MRTRLILIISILLILASFSVVAEDLSIFTVFSNGNLVLRDRVKIIDCFIGSNIYTQMGFDSELYGNVLSRGNMLMLDRADVYGNVKLGGTLTGTKVHGTTIQRASVAFVSIPTISFSAGETDLTIDEGEIKALLPGSYRNVLVKSNASLRLVRGTYSFNSLTLQNDVTAYFDRVAGDPVDVRVLGELKVGDRVKLLLGRGGAIPSDV